MSAADFVHSLCDLFHVFYFGQLHRKGVQLNGAIGRFRKHLIGNERVCRSAVEVIPVYRRGCEWNSIEFKLV